MTPLQEAFLGELKRKAKWSVAEYAALYKEHSKRAIEYEKENGASEQKAKAMGNYYTVTVLSDFVGNENILGRIIALHEST